MDKKKIIEKLIIIGEQIYEVGCIDIISQDQFDKISEARWLIENLISELKNN